MRIITADPTGLCFGVKRAITTLEEELKKESATNIIIDSAQVEKAEDKAE